MSLYRQPGRVGTRIVALAAAGALVVGGVAGFAIGRASKDDPSLAAQVAGLRSDLEPVGNAMELVRTEYPQARGGAPTEMVAVRGDLARARAALGAHRDDLAAVRPDVARALVVALTSAERVAAAKGPPAAMDRAAAAVDAALSRLGG